MVKLQKAKILAKLVMMLLIMLKDKPLVIPKQVKEVIQQQKFRSKETSDRTVDRRS
jgi:hypothetical protein